MQVCCRRNTTKIIFRLSPDTAIYVVQPRRYYPFIIALSNFIKQAFAPLDKNIRLPSFEFDSLGNDPRQLLEMIRGSQIGIGEKHGLIFKIQYGADCRANDGSPIRGCQNYRPGI